MPGRSEPTSVEGQSLIDVLHLLLRNLEYRYRRTALFERGTQSAISDRARRIGGAVGTEGRHPAGPVPMGTIRGGFGTTQSRGCTLSLYGWRSGSNQFGNGRLQR